MRPDEHRLAAWRSLIHANAALSEVLERELQCDLGMPLAWYDVLLKLDEAGGQLRMQDLARQVLLSKSGVTRLVDRLCAAGLVDRSPTPADRRGMLAVLTVEGKERLRDAAPVHLRGIEAHFASLISDEEAAVLRDVCDRLLAALRQQGPGQAEDACDT